MHSSPLVITSIALVVLGCGPHASDNDNLDAGVGDDDTTLDGASGSDAEAPTLPPYDQPGLTFAYDVDAAGTYYRSTTTIGAPIQIAIGTVYPHSTIISGYSEVTTSQFLVEDGTIAVARTTNNSGSLAYDPPLVSFKAGLSPGDSWSQSVTVSDFTSGTATVHNVVVGEETITVPAGTFTCLRLRVDYTGIFGNFGFDQWWSPTAGSVLYVFESGGTETRSELAVAPH